MPGLAWVTEPCAICSWEISGTLTTLPEALTLAPSDTSSALLPPCWGEVRLAWATAAVCNWEISGTLTTFPEALTLASAPSETSSALLPPCPGELLPRERLSLPWATEPCAVAVCSSETSGTLTICEVELTPSAISMALPALVSPELLLLELLSLLELLQGQLQAEATVGAASKIREANLIIAGTS